MNLFKKIPKVILFGVISCVYLACGYMVGYHQGYKDGQEDYIVYINQIFESIQLIKSK
jgi:hypothetical protein